MMTDKVTTANRLDWLDALRGWAAFAVVLVHTEIAIDVWPGLWRQLTWSCEYGVQLFFIVSAITISITYESHIRKYGDGLRASLSWLVKRIFRIAPLYYVAILFYAFETDALYRATDHHLGSPPNSLLDILANVAFVHTWVPSANNSVVPGGWSIGVEMFFYLLVPFIWRVRDERARAIVLGLAILPALASSLLVSLLTTGSSFIRNGAFPYFWFPTQYPVFALGLIFCLFVIKPGHMAASGRRPWRYLLASAVLFLLGPIFGTWKSIAPILAPVFVSAAFLCLIMSLHGGIGRALVNPAAMFLGRISYSVYIFHFAVLDFFKLLAFGAQAGTTHSPAWLVPMFPATLVVTAAIAYASKRFLEDPGIRLGHRLSDRIARARWPLAADASPSRSAG
jgi:peptidoglycan/LPS O-acetylase OafA/YrhL